MARNSGLRSVGRQHPAGVGRGEHVAGGVERAGGRARVGRDQGHLVVQTVVAVGRDEVARIGHGDQVVRLVVGVACQRAAGLGDGQVSRRRLWFQLREALKKRRIQPFSLNAVNEVVLNRRVFRSQLAVVFNQSGDGFF